MSERTAKQKRAMGYLTGPGRYVASPPRAADERSPSTPVDEVHLQIAAWLDKPSFAERRSATWATMHRVNLAVLGPYALAEYVDATFDISNLRVSMNSPAFVDITSNYADLLDRQDVSPRRQQQQLDEFLFASLRNYKIISKNPAVPFMVSIDGVMGSIAILLHEMTGDVEASRAFALEFRNGVARRMQQRERTAESFNWFIETFDVDDVERIGFRLIRDLCDQRKDLDNPNADTGKLGACLDCPKITEEERRGRIEATFALTQDVDGEIQQRYQVRDALGREFCDFIRRELPEIAARRFDGTSTTLPVDQSPDFSRGLVCSIA